MTILSPCIRGTSYIMYVIGEGGFQIAYMKIQKKEYYNITHVTHVTLTNFTKF